MLPVLYFPSVGPGIVLNNTAQFILVLRLTFVKEHVYIHVKYSYSLSSSFLKTSDMSKCQVSSESELYG